jgi:hypothetical protein
MSLSLDVADEIGGCGVLAVLPKTSHIAHLDELAVTVALARAGVTCPYTTEKWTSAS